MRKAGWIVKKSEIALIAVAAALLIVAIALLALLLQSHNDNKGLRGELAVAQNRLAFAQSELGMTKAGLEEKNGEIGRQEAQIGNLTLSLESKLADIEELRAQLNDSEAELDEARDALADAEEDIARIREEALAMDGQINESISWFRENAELPSALKTDRYSSMVEKHCESDGTLNLACASFLMEDELGFTYKDDPGGDRLYSIDEIIQRKGGDCEDYALFFKAYLGHLDDADLELEAWTEGSGRYEVYEDSGSGRYWYYDDADGMAIGNSGTDKPYAVCYYYDTEGPTLIGHCVVMLSEKEIASPKDITNANLGGAALFEPQDGGFVGSIGDGFTVCEDGDDGCDTRDYALTFIITDSDLFQFSGGEWGYYAGREAEVQELLSELEGIRTG